MSASLALRLGKLRKPMAMLKAGVRATDKAGARAKDMVKAGASKATVRATAKVWAKFKPR